MILHWISLSRLLIFFNLIQFLFTSELTDYSYDQSIAYKLLSAGQKREVQNALLGLFGLDHRPKPKRKDLLSSIHLKSMYHQFFNEDTLNLIDDQYPLPFYDQSKHHGTVKAFDESDVIVSFVDDNGPTYGGTDSTLNSASRFWFNTREISPGSQVLSAELRLYKNEIQSHSGVFDIFRINIYLIEKDHNKRLRLIGSKTFSNVRGWLTFNVTSAIQTWIDNPNRNSGLYVTIHSTSNGKELTPESIGLDRETLDTDKRPFILAFFKHSNILHRKKREVTKNDEVSPNKPYNPYYELSEFISNRICQKKSLYVSFKDIGWQDWIIAPEGYAASFCDGECSFPLTAQTNATNHAIVQTLVHTMYPDSVPKACCAPTKLSSIMVLYFDDNANVILKKYRNMVVKSCGCH